MKAKKIRLGDLTEFMRRGVSPRYVDSDGLIVLNQKCVRDNRIDYGPSRFSDLNLKVPAEKFLRSGDLLVNSTGEGTLGRTALFAGAEHPVIVDSHLTIIRPSNEIDSAYLAHYLASIEPLIESLARGSTNQTELSSKSLAALEIPCLPLSTQRKISGVLTAHSELMENNRRRMTLLESTARLLYREWFVRLHFPGNQKSRIANGVPEGWERIATSEAVEINPVTKLSDEEEHWYVEMASLPTDSMVIHNTVKRNGRSGSKFQNGDTLFARITPCLENGKTSFVNFMAAGEVGRGSTEFIVLRSKRVPPEFVYCLARTYHFRENAIKSMVGSSGRQRVQESCFEKFMVLIPPHFLLDLFSEFVEPIFQQIKVLHAQDQKLRAARDLLLPRLMSGEIAV